MTEFDKIKDSKSILLVHPFLAMGDAILLSPVYKTIKDNIRGVDITVLTNQYAMPFVKAIPVVDHVYSIESIFRRGASRIEVFLRLCMFFIKNRFDTIILRGDKRLPQRALNLAARICLLKTISLGTHLEEEVLANRHIVDAYFRILEKIGMKVKEKGRLYVTLPDSAVSESKVFLENRTGKLAGIAPVSNIQIKNWPAEKTAELINKLKGLSYDTVLFCADREYSKKVRNLLAEQSRNRLTTPNTPPPQGEDSVVCAQSNDKEGAKTCKKDLFLQHNTTGNNVFVVDRVDFSLLMGIVSLCKIFIGVDTGPTHLAAALGVPTVGLFGPTSGTVAGPYSERSTYIQSSVTCYYYNPLALFSPKEKPMECYLEDRCKLPAKNCMDGVTLEEVMEAVHRIVQ
jgi:ADP-heptose:LPS heptosyltransferase